MAEQLKPCPYCGGPAALNTNSFDPESDVISCGCMVCGASEETEEMWNQRAPGPATKAMLEWLRGSNRPVFHPQDVELITTFLAEWPDPATPPAPEPSSRWKCSLCGEPVRINDDLTVIHVREIASPWHEAKLSDADRKTLADGLRLTD